MGGVTEHPAGTIDFRYDATNDVVIATPHWSIETEDDVRAWYAQYVEHFSQYGRPVDVVYVLDDFSLKPSMGVFWGEYRAEIQRTFTRFSYRVHSAYGVKLFVHTSGSRHKVATEEASTVEEAIERIHAARREAGVE